MLTSDQGLWCGKLHFPVLHNAFLNNILPLKSPRVGKRSPWGLRMFCILSFEAIIIARLKLHWVYLQTHSYQLCTSLQKVRAARRRNLKFKRHSVFGLNLEVAWVLQHVKLGMRVLSLQSLFMELFMGSEVRHPLKHFPDFWLWIITTVKKIPLLKTALSSAFTCRSYLLWYLRAATQ